MSKCLVRETVSVEYTYIDHDLTAGNRLGYPRKLVRSSIKVVTNPALSDEEIANAVKKYAEINLLLADVAVEKIIRSGHVFLEV